MLPLFYCKLYTYAFLFFNNSFVNQIKKIVVINYHQLLVVIVIRIKIFGKLDPVKKSLKIIPLSISSHYLENSILNIYELI